MDSACLSSQDEKQVLSCMFQQWYLCGKKHQQQSKILGTIFAWRMNPIS